MLWNVSNLNGCSIEARDGSIGTLAGFLFNDQEWTVRWAVINAGTWLMDRKVLLPPTAFGTPDAATRSFPVDLTREQVKESPEIDAHAPVSRQHEADIYAYYGWHPYWAGTIYPPPAGVAATPVEPATVPPERRQTAGEPPEGDPHLRDTHEVTGYYIHATDGDVGHIEDFMIDSDSWMIRYIVIDTRNWWPGKKVLVSPRRFEAIDWSEGTARVDLTQEEIRNGPEYDPSEAADHKSADARDYLWYPYV